MESGADPASAPLLEAHDLGRRRPDGNGWLLRVESLRITAGERLAIVGPTGSGKTLLLRSLALLDRLDRGELLWQGQAVSAADVPAYRSQVAYLHQRPVLSSGSVEDNLRQPFTLRTYRDRRFDRDQILSLLSDVQRGEEFLAQPERELSGGERQIVALLRVLQLAPIVLMLDEPTAALDAATAGAIEGLVNRWFDSDNAARTVLWVSHDHGQLRRVAERVLSMRDGHLQEGD